MLFNEGTEPKNFPRQIISLQNIHKSKEPEFFQEPPKNCILIPKDLLILTKKSLLGKQLPQQVKFLATSLSQHNGLNSISSLVRSRSNAEKCLFSLENSFQGRTSTRFSKYNMHPEKSSIIESDAVTRRNFLCQ